MSDTEFKMSGKKFINQVYCK